MTIIEEDPSVCALDAEIWDFKAMSMQMTMKTGWRYGKNRFQSSKGLTLLEVLVAIGVLAFGILAVGSMQVTSIQQNDRADRITEASVLGRDRLERLMALAYTDSALDEGSDEDDNPPTGYSISWEICDGGSAGCDTIDGTKLFSVTVQHDDLDKDVVLVDVKPQPP